tara:strand:+ start:772 stop:939 length:168 start_codon:yes stop_codon:yes gene_type:complete
MQKMTVLYKRPNDAEKFKTYYKEKYLPRVYKTESEAENEITKIKVILDGEHSDYL